MLEVGSVAGWGSQGRSVELDNAWGPLKDFNTVLKGNSWRRFSYRKLDEGWRAQRAWESWEGISSWLWERGWIWERIIFRSSSEQGFGTSLWVGRDGVLLWSVPWSTAPFWSSVWVMLPVGSSFEAPFVSLKEHNQNKDLLSCLLYCN